MILYVKRRMTEAEFKQEVALLLFASGKLSLGYASKLAEMDKIQFKQLFQKRKIPLYSYEIKDFELESEKFAGVR